MRSDDDMSGWIMLGGIILVVVSLLCVVEVLR
jgi:hypothetical protein